MHTKKDEPTEPSSFFEPIEIENRVIKSIGNKIKEIRLSEKMSQEAFADKIGASLSYIKKVESGELTPSVEFLCDIETIVGVSITKFFTVTELQYDLFPQKTYNNAIIQGNLVDGVYKLLLTKNTLFYHPSFHPYLIGHHKTQNIIYHQHPGWELLILRSGKLKVLLRDDNASIEKELKEPFDILLFNSNTQHAYIPQEDEETETFCIISDTEHIKNINDQRELKEPLPDTKKKVKLLGSKIKEIRLSKKMSQADLANAIKRTSSYVTRVESGEIIPSIWRLYDIAKSLQVDIIDLFAIELIQYDLFSKNPSDLLIQGKYLNCEFNLLSTENTLYYNLPFHPYLMKFTKDEVKYRRHPGWELVILRSGKLKVILSKDEDLKEIREIFLEKPFDMLLFNSTFPHTYIPEGEEAEIICVISDTKNFRNIDEIKKTRTTTDKSVHS